MWFVYIVKCSDNTLYTGIAIDINQRVNEHNSSKKGAKYTKARRPVELVYEEVADNRSLASKREYSIKKLSRIEKIRLIKTNLTTTNN